MSAASGIVGALFCVVWYFLGYSSPKEHPRISPEELEYIESTKTFNSDDKVNYYTTNYFIITLCNHHLFVFSRQTKVLQNSFYEKLYYDIVSASGKSINIRHRYKSVTIAE